jgi:hypothetical protein
VPSAGLVSERGGWVFSGKGSLALQSRIQNYHTQLSVDLYRQPRFWR